MRTWFAAICIASLAVGSVPCAGASNERARPTASEKVTLKNGIQISYRSTGPLDGRAMLLVAGTGMQHIEWPLELVDGLVKQGFRVIMFDHRDAGESTHYSKEGMPDWGGILAALAQGKEPALSYTADDMAADVLGLLDALAVKEADMLGISGGATIAQLVTITQPERVRTLTLIAANSGNPTLPMPAKPARLASIPQPKAGATRQALIDRQLAVYRALAGSQFGINEMTARQLAEQTVSRDTDPFGFARQGAALIVLGDLRARQAKITKPTLVVHGSDDPLISPQSGREVAEAIPGSRFLSIPGMGHDLPSAVIPTILAAVKENTLRQIERPQ